MMEDRHDDSQETADNLIIFFMVLCVVFSLIGYFLSQP